MPKALIGLATSVAMAVFVTGCGKEAGGAGAENAVPVSGTVYMDGQPLEGAEVNFASEEFSDVAITGADGRYTLPVGAVPGENSVFISKFKGENLVDDPDALNEARDIGQLEAQAEADLGAGVPGSATPEQVIPPKYSDPEKSTLKYPVPEGGTDKADFRITSK